MNRTELVLMLAILGACASPPRTAKRPQIPPPGPSLSREAREFERQQAQRVDEEATKAFLEQEIERNKPPEPTPPPSQPTVQAVRYVERPVYVQRRAYADEYPYYYESARHYHGDHYTSPFPWNTAIGAGMGAIIGHQSGHRGEGAAIGAGVGLLLDLGRWHW